jgi:hypothetical protein
VNAHDIETGWLQQESLDGVMDISIECDQVDFAFEADETLAGGLQLIAQPAQNAPVVERSGSTVMIKQEGKYKGRVVPLVRLPASDCPSLSLKLGKGDLSFRDVQASVSIKLGMGDLEVRNGSGEVLASLGKGDIAVVGRAQKVALKTGLGDTAISRCTGGVSVSIGRGDISLSECGAGIELRSGSGDVAVNRPMGGGISIHTGSGDVAVIGGEADSLIARAGKGDVVSTTRLLVSPDTVEDTPEPDDDDATFELFDDEDDDAFSRGSLEFEAGDDGVRIGRGNRNLLTMGPSGIQISRRGREISLGPDGIRVGGPASESPGAERFTFDTGRGDIRVDLPNDLNMRVEVLATGDVQSDVPLVSVGRPGPRGTVKRLVGVSDGVTAGARVNVRLRTKRGDVGVRLVRVQPRVEVTPQAADEEMDREEQARVILEALSLGDLSVSEAERLLAALDRAD